MSEREMPRRPMAAIVDPNTLAVMGLRQLLQDVVPFAEICCFGSFSELMANNPDDFFHYFVAMNIVLENRPFFLERRRRTIVLSPSNGSGLSDFHSLCVNVPERVLVRSILSMVQHAHPHGKNHPPQGFPTPEKRVLTDREMEVMALIVRGHINKEIADMLHIGLSTVITHRKNIMEKVGVRSVSALTIYAVMNGFVDVNKI